MITLKNVQFEYQPGKPLLKNINVTIHEGECVLITGPSGSGKTTLGRILNGLIPSFYEGNLQGEIIIESVHTKDAPIWELSKKLVASFKILNHNFSPLSFKMNLLLNLKIMELKEL